MRVGELSLYAEVTVIAEACGDAGDEGAEEVLGVEAVALVAVTAPFAPLTDSFDELNSLVVEDTFVAADSWAFEATPGTDDDDFKSSVEHNNSVLLLISSPFSCLVAVGIVPEAGAGCRDEAPVVLVAPDKFSANTGGESCWANFEADGRLSPT